MLFIFLGVNLYTENETIGELEYEIDNEKFLGRENLGLPAMIENSKTLSKELGLVTDPCIAIKRTFKIKPGDKEICLHFKCSYKMCLSSF